MDSCIVWLSDKGHARMRDGRWQYVPPHCTSSDGVRSYETLSLLMQRERHLNHKLRGPYGWPWAQQDTRGRT